MSRVVDLRSNRSNDLVNVGKFWIESNMIEICDPVVNETFIKYTPAPMRNSTTLYVRNCIPGLYQVVYELFPNGSPCRCYLLSGGLFFSRYEELRSGWEEKGRVYGTISHSLCAVESTGRDEVNSTFFDIEPDAIYDPSDLIHSLVRSPYPASVTKALNDACADRVTEGVCIYGSELCEIIGDEPKVNWNGFKENVRTNHWGYDAAYRVKQGDAGIPVAMLSAGIVLDTFDVPACDIFVRRVANGMISGITIDFSYLEVDEKGVERSILAPTRNIVGFSRPE